MTVPPETIALQACDGHRFELLARTPDAPVASLLWLPALGVAARHYLPFAEALAARGIAVFVHEWRGHGSSSLRAGHDCNWGYRALLLEDLPRSEAAIEAALPGVPRIIGGHSLGGQLACCRLALAPASASRLWLVASGSPYWRAFPLPHRLMLPLVARFLPWLSDRAGALPGRRIGFGGQEARGVMRDWARTSLSGRYAGHGIDADLEAGMQHIAATATGIVFPDDWLAPRPSLQFLLSKMPKARTDIHVLDAKTLGAAADHFTWMQSPDTVARSLVQSLTIGDNA